MITTARRTAGLAAAAAFAILLGGCSLLGGGDAGLARNAGGHITVTAKADVTELVAGDCFSFQGEDRGSKPVTVTPCAKPHGFRVIQIGSATDAQVAKDGSLQNAMSVACKKEFTAFAATVEGDTTPELQFLVYSSADTDSNAKKDARQRYSCISTDPAVSAAKG